MNDCIFCDIIKQDRTKQDLAKILYEDEHCIVIPDKFPAYKKHFLIITKQHFVDLNDIAQNNPAILGHIMANIKIITELVGLPEYKLFIHNGAGANQKVMHLHIHICCNQRK